MPSAASFESFQHELSRLVIKFERGLDEFKNPAYLEAQLRDDFLSPLFAALGWDLKNDGGLIQSHREVEIESRVDSGRADYLFRTDRKPRFVCEAKKPAEELPGHAQQAKGYAWTIGVPVAVLTDFEELNVYIVGSEPKKEEPLVGLWRSYSFRDYAAQARELWDLLARDNVAAGVIDRTVAALPKKPFKIGKGQWVVRPDPTRNFDNTFLNFLDGARRSLASDLLRHNEAEDWNAGTRLNEAVQCILDRLLFIRISEARGIDMGTKLVSLLETWEKRHKSGGGEMNDAPPAGWGGAGLGAPRGSLWNSIVRHIRALDRRPPSHVPFFNGNLFKLHFTEELVVGDDWLADFLEKICNEYASYKFGYIAVEILGTIYERFLGKIVRPHGRGAVIEEKPEVRKAGGVYYTPRYIVEYIVEQTVGKRLEGRKPEETLQLRFLDPACGSGSFLLRVFERVCEHWQEWLMDHPAKRKKDWCWLDAQTNTLHLTVRLKRRILRETVYGVDLDPQAVEVTQLSLYLKMLEHETAETLQREQDLFGGDEAILPPLQDNIKCGNSLIASDFSMMPEDLVRVRAFDWPVQFAPIMRAGGFDAVIGNPPYIRIQTLQESDAESVEYLNQTYTAAKKGNYDIYVCFVERALSLLNPAGRLGYILPHKFFNAQYGEALRAHLTSGKHLNKIVHFGDQQIFEGATTYTCLLFLTKSATARFEVTKVTDLEAWRASGSSTSGALQARELESGEWNFHVGHDSKLFARLSGFKTTLGDVAARMAQGIRTSANEVYVLDVKHDGPKVLQAESEILQRQVKLERKLVSRFLQGRDIKRYTLLDSGKVVVIPYRLVDDGLELVSEKELKDSHPNTYEYLRENKSYLENRERGRMKGAGWYGYVYPKNLDVMKRPKILVPDIADGASYALDETGEFAFTSGYAITLKPEVKVSPKFVLGLLNSKLLDFFLKKVSTTMRGGFFRYFTQFIERIPIVVPDLSKPADKSRHDKLVVLVDKLLGLMPKLRAAKSDSEKAVLQNAVTTTDRQIDALVYDLYGLTEAEIKLVEHGQ